MGDLTRRLGSVQLTVALILVLAATSAMGTFLPSPQQPELLEKAVGELWARFLRAAGLADLFHSWWYRALLLLLSINMAACLVQRLPAVRSALRGDAALRREPVAVLAPERIDGLRRALSSLGYKPGRQPDREIFGRGGLSYALHYTFHISIIVIMVSSLAGSLFGFIGTQRIPVGYEASSIYNWSLERDMDLPFTVRPRDLVSRPHPVSLRVGITDAATGKKTGLVSTYTGGPLEVPGLGRTFTVTAFDPDSGSLRIRDDVSGRSWDIPKGGRTLGDPGVVITPVAFASWPDLKEVLSPTAIYENGREVARAEIAVNHPMKYRGVRIYLTDYGVDKFGFPYVGYQFVRDPGQPGVWVGCVVFLVTLTGAVFTRHSCVVIVPEPDRIRVHLSSRGDRRRDADDLKRVIEEAGGTETAASPAAPGGWK